MPIKLILVPLFGDDADRPSLDTALLLARAHDAHLRTIHVRRNPASELLAISDPGLGAAGVGPIIEAAEAEIAERAEKARAGFQAWVTASGVEINDDSSADTAVSASFAELHGQAVDIVARHGRLADLIVLARALGDKDDFRRAPTIVEALIGSGRPLLLAADMAPSSIGRSVAIAWNGSAESSRAVSGAMPILRRAKTVTVLTAPEKGSMGEDAEHLAASLGRHAIRPDVVHVAGQGDLAQDLLDAAEAAKADLLVMGAYSHSRLREEVFGGVTRKVLSGAPLPVLLVH